MTPGTYDRLKGVVKAVVDAATRRVDFFALYPSKVVSQNGDNSLELQPDSPTLPAFSRVPLRLGIPGATAKVQAGSRVLLGFEGGDPRAPVATLWDAGSVLVELDIGASPTSFVALATLVSSQLNALATAINSHVHTSNGTPPVTGPGGVPVSIGNVASTTIKST